MTLTPTPTQFTVRVLEHRLQLAETQWLPVEVVNPAGVSNLNIALEFDPRIAKVETKPTVGGVVGQRLFETNFSEPGRVRLGFAGSSGITQDGIMTMIPFTASGNPGKRTALKVTESSANHTDGQPLESTTVDGELEVVAKGGAGSGDVNSDGQVNALDALAALKMSVKLIPDNMAADMDQDGTITSNDARLIMLKYVGR